MTTETELLLDGLCFPEGPRWHDGELWFSDMHAKAVLRVGLDGRATRVVDVAAGSGDPWTILSHLAASADAAVCLASFARLRKLVAAGQFEFSKTAVTSKSRGSDCFFQFVRLVIAIAEHKVRRPCRE